MQSVNLDIAGEFLEIAATLILIKSRHLLPKPIEEMEDEDEENPEEILRMRLSNTNVSRMLLLKSVPGMCSGGTFSPVLKRRNLFRIKAKQILNSRMYPSLP